ncbi:hypothetical protein [Ruegeria atlantica]|uniref:hypothetical protein n=1 Tax=Ruegeria atlantica TaxID=81569 RepID=UPI0024949CF3|nr:hypothetical protein [Ruegeria atlantica]
MFDGKLHPDNEKRKSQSLQLPSLGLAITKIYLVVLVVGLPFAVFLGAIELKPLEVNELGDFLAGMFGPLAIFWLVLGFFQQSRELQNSVDALNLQAKELAHSVEQQKEMVRVTRETLEHEKEVLNLQAQSKKDSLQPKLEIKFGTNSRSGNQYNYFVRVTNIGHAITNFSIDVFVNDNKFLSLSKDLLLFEGTEERRTGDKFEPITEGLSAVVFFDDSEGDKFKIQYTVSHLESDSDWPRYTVQRTSHEKIVPT